MLTQLQKDVQLFLSTPDICQTFNTDKVYEKVEFLHIKEANLEEYEKYIQYINNPTKKINEYVEMIAKEKIEKMIYNHMVPEYKETIEMNLLAFRRRLEIVRSIIFESGSFDDPCNFFVVK